MRALAGLGGRRRCGRGSCPSGPVAARCETVARASLSGGAANPVLGAAPGPGQRWRRVPAPRHTFPGWMRHGARRSRPTAAGGGLPRALKEARWPPPRALPCLALLARLAAARRGAGGSGACGLCPGCEGTAPGRGGRETRGNGGRCRVRREMPGVSAAWGRVPLLHCPNGLPGRGRHGEGEPVLPSG